MESTSGAGQEALTSRKWRRVLIASVIIFDLAVAVIAPPIDNHFSPKYYTALMSGSAAVAVVTLVGFVFILRSTRGVTSTEAVRDSIAIAFVVVFLVILGWSSFYAQAEVPGLAKTLVPDFIGLMGVVLAFYFGTTVLAKFVEAKYESSAPAEQSHPEDRISDVPDK
ncbi:hypothetical protein O7628_32145 [Micromonospora sp. WMMD956]|uniref:hypothetical protein n=1 Tax=Micromonospora sp. WMMD956 TaxID=3016108 RepID=UPI002415B152|nr:hypothetical protein [Micromonospora sp. WMMD956]MDG4820158.1 hypothetical protein [Micromonospora sp. WMMD956]